MPRAKATDVVIHRIELGGKERELAEGLVAAFQFNRIANPIVAALSDVSFIIVVGGILAAYKYIDQETWESLSAGLESAPELIGAMEKSYGVAQRKYREAGELVGGEGADPIVETALSVLFPWSIPFRAGRRFVDEVT